MPADAAHGAQRCSACRARSAFAVHIFTASGAALALLALLAAVERRLAAMFLAGSASRCSSTASTARSRGGSMSRSDCRAGPATCSISWSISSPTCSCRPTRSPRAGCCRTRCAMPLRDRDHGHRRALFRRPRDEDRGQLFPRLSGGVERAGVLSVPAAARSVDRRGGDCAACGADLRAGSASCIRSACARLRMRRLSRCLRLVGARARRTVARHDARAMDHRGIVRHRALFPRRRACCGAPRS